MDNTTTQQNKQAVMRFNKEVIENGDAQAFAELMDPEFVDRTAAPGLPADAKGMWFVFHELLRPALHDLRVEVHDQVAEADKVITRKTLRGTHRGALFGIAPTQRELVIDVIDIVRLRNGRYLEHWGINTLASVLTQLQSGS